MYAKNAASYIHGGGPAYLTFFQTTKKTFQNKPMRASCSTKSVTTFYCLKPPPSLPSPPVNNCIPVANLLTCIRISQALTPLPPLHEPTPRNFQPVTTDLIRLRRYATRAERVKFSKFAHTALSGDPCLSLAWIQCERLQV